jgi:sterol desaturase/sphingolipid hydroxylase (fatty acid hydroxylase superfamily)
MLAEHVGAAILVTLTLVVAVVFGYRQCRLIRKADSGGPSEERAVLRASARRRLLVSVMIGLCGVLIAGPYFTGLADRVAHDGQRQDAREYFLWWAAVMVLLMVSLAVIGYDMAVVRRHWRKSLRRLNDDRRAMMQRQLARLRAERGGSNGVHDG